LKSGSVGINNWKEIFGKFDAFAKGEYII
jgi:hypothetical protein